MDGKKIEALRERFRALTRRDVAVAFSGGVDSALVLKLAQEYAGENGRQVYAITVKTQLHPMGDMELAGKVAKELGAAHIVMSVDEFAEAGIQDNPKDRCYLCKKLLFTKMLEKAHGLGIHTILEGTNLDDTKEYRPGLRALEELSIISPLREAGFSKAEVRELAGELGISVATRPAAPCMATRFPYGTHLTREGLWRVEQGERLLRKLGLGELRLRIHQDFPAGASHPGEARGGEIARIEVPAECFGQVLEHREDIIAGLKALGYLYVTLDLQGFRSGSMDEAFHSRKTP